MNPESGSSSSSLSGSGGTQYGSSDSTMESQSSPVSSMAPIDAAGIIPPFAPTNMSFSQLHGQHIPNVLRSSQAQQQSHNIQQFESRRFQQGQQFPISHIQPQHQQLQFQSGSAGLSSSVNLYPGEMRYEKRQLDIICQEMENVLRGMPPKQPQIHDKQSQHKNVPAKSSVVRLVYYKMSTAGNGTGIKYRTGHSRESAKKPRKHKGRTPPALKVSKGSYMIKKPSAVPRPEYEVVARYELLVKIARLLSGDMQLWEDMSFLERISKMSQRSSAGTPVKKGYGQDSSSPRGPCSTTAPKGPQSPSSVFKFPHTPPQGQQSPSSEFRFPPTPPQGQQSPPLFTFPPTPLFTFPSTPPQGQQSPSSEFNSPTTSSQGLQNLSSELTFPSPSSDFGFISSEFTFPNPSSEFTLPSSEFTFPNPSSESTVPTTPSLPILSSEFTFPSSSLTLPNPSSELMFPATPQGQQDPSSPEFIFPTTPSQDQQNPPEQQDPSPEFTFPTPPSQDQQSASSELTFPTTLFKGPKSN